MDADLPGVVMQTLKETTEPMTSDEVAHAVERPAQHVREALRRGAGVHSRMETARRKLRAHDRGEDRHNKGLSWIKKQTRLRSKR